MGSLDSVVFGKKKFSNILEEIYNNQKKKEKQISGLISELKPLINDIGDATLIVMATIVQRALNNSSSEDALGITDEEKQQLMEELDKLNTNFEDKKDGK
jgi:hypothetical protein